MTNNTPFKIDLEKVYFEFDLGIKKVRFYRTDENIKRLRTEFSDLNEKYKTLSEKNEDDLSEENVDEAVSMLKRVWDNTLQDENGNDTFDEIYEKYPSVFVLTDALSDIYYHIHEQLKVQQIKAKQDKAKDYIDKKRKK